MARYPSKIVTISFLGLGLLSSGHALAQSAAVGENIPVLGKYTAPASNEDSKPRGISGMSCLPQGPDSKRECLTINDEEAFGEIAILEPAGLRPTGIKLVLAKKGEKGDGIVGKERVAACGDTKKFGEVDGEGVVTSGGYTYIVSSHSCSGGGKYKPSSYLIARFKNATATSFLANTVPAVERTWRGADLLTGSAAGSAYGGKKGEGTNIEGVAVVGKQLYAGLRTPSKGDEAYLANAPVDELFAAGASTLPGGVVKTRMLKLGKDTGIRDLAALNDGGLLILSGPTKSQAEVSFKLWQLPVPIETSEPIEIAVLQTSMNAKNDEVAKAESVTLMEQTGPKISVIISYDNIDEGAPTRFELSLPR